MPSNLTYLDLSSNPLNGTLPDTISVLVNLVYLYLNFNSFHGTIPDSISDLTSAYTLHLSDNCLSGTIPSSIGLLVELGELQLQNNLFVGSVPDSFCNLTTVHLVYFCDNNVDLTGCPFLSSVPNCIEGDYTDYRFGNLTVTTLALTAPPAVGQMSALPTRSASPTRVPTSGLNSMSPITAPTPHSFPFIASIRYINE